MRKPVIVSDFSGTVIEGPVARVTVDFGDRRVVLDGTVQEAQEILSNAQNVNYRNRPGRKAQAEKQDETLLEEALAPTG